MSYEAAIYNYPSEESIFMFNGRSYPSELHPMNSILEVSIPQTGDIENALNYWLSFVFKLM